ncbi:hypothetical protein AeRB84_015153 [Aphanomyces euteiches]|nr:hypothetical protein AeRB84_015153 [Aphanomyces euteiches]
MNKVRCLLQDTGLDYQFWGEALNYVVYTENRSPTKALGVRTQFQVIYGRWPNIEHLRSFGCVEYAFIDKSMRSKLKPRATKCVFLGYASQRKSYRLQGPQVVDDREDADDIDDQPEQSPPRHQVTFTDDVAIRNSPSASPAQVEPPHPEDPASADDEEGSTSDSDVQVPEPGSLEAISGGFHQSYSVQVVNETPWLEATQVEYDSLIENGTWTLTDLPPSREALKCKWLWRMKFDADGKLTKYKARLDLKGYMQQYGIDYLEIFAPVLRMNALRLLLCLVAHHAWKLRQMDVKTAFLNGTLDTDTVIFIEQPPGIAVQGEESKVCRLIKSIYDLKQAPRCWYLTLHSFLVRIGFERCVQEVCLYTKRVGDSVVLLSVYVDDITITGNDDQQIEKACNALKD